MSDYRDTIIQLRTEQSKLRVRDQQIEEAIRNLQRLEGQGPVEVDPSNPNPLKDLTYGAAAELLLREKGPLGTRDLADAMLQGGVRTKSRNFVATLYESLRKLPGQFRLNAQTKKWELNKGKRT